MNNYLSKVLEVIKFTISLLLKDKKSLVILLLMPFILVAVLGVSLSSAFDGSEFSFETVKLGIVDEDQTIASRLLVNNGFNNEEIKQIVLAEEFKNREEAEDSFLQQQIDGILYIHEGYEYNFIYGYKDNLVLKMNPTKSLQTDIMKQVLNQYHVIGKMVVDAVNGGRSITNFPSVNSFLTDQSITLEVNSSEKKQKGIDSFQYYAVGMGVMYALFTALTGVSYIIVEHQQYTYQRIMMMPFPIGVFYIGKSIAFTLISILQLIILFGSTHFAFNVDFGNHPFTLLLVIISYALASSGIMVLLSRWINNQSTLNVFFSIGVPLIAALGGSMIPVESFPWYIEYISKILPNRHAMEGMFEVMLNRPEQATSSILFLLAFALITTIIGLMQIKRREDTSR